MATIRKLESLNRLIKQKMTTKNNLILIRYFTFLFVFNFFSVITKAQNAHKIDSLKTILNRTSSDSIKCLVLGILIEEESNDLLWPEYNQQLFELAQKNVKTLKGNSNQYYTKKLAESINNFGFIEQLNGNIPKALQQYQKSLQLHLKINNQAGIASSYNNVGAIYDWQGKKELAKEYFIKSLIIYEQLKDKDGIAFSYNNLATYYDNVGDISKALEYYHKSIKLYEEMNDNYGLASALLNVSIVYLNQNDTLKALEFQ